jgi:bifunctional N-acetylglucosamine-1-phosphate-uridyltransferase/glucosamine-1-phosphate-acetyltransferase GlmU-like protein
VKGHITAGAAVTVLTTIPVEPQGYGRIVKREDGSILKIVEELDATDVEKKIGEINTGIYCVNTPFLFSALGKIDNNNNQKEYYLTDIVEIACREGEIARPYIVLDYIEVMGINTPEELFRAGQYLQNNRKYPD